MANPRSLVAPLLVASAALIVAAVGFVVLIFGNAVAADGLLPLRAITIVASPTLLALALAVLLRRGQSLVPAAAWLFVVLVALGSASGLLFTLAFGAGADDSDAGRPMGVLARVAWPAALAALLLLGAALVALMLALIPAHSPRSRRVRMAVSGGAGVLGALPVFIAVITPVAAGIAAFGLVVTLLLVTRTGTGAVPTARNPLGNRAPARAMVRRMGILALAIVSAAWVTGAAVGISQAGHPIATTAMGLSSAFARLAAIPLVLAITAALRARGHLPAGARPIGLVPIVGVAVGTLVQAAVPDGVGLFAGAAIAGPSIGGWLALLVLPTVPRVATVRFVTFLALTIGGTMAWFIAVPLSGGIALAIPAGFLAFGGAGLAVGYRQAAEIRPAA